MGISLKLFISRILGKVPIIEVEYSKNNLPDRPEFSDKRNAQCPTCDKELKKIPGAKTKCPYCSQFMYVRTLPKTNERMVLVTRRSVLFSS